MTDPWAIEATELRKSYGEAQVLAGIELKVKQGSIFSLLGPNGAGKTTTVRILATLLRPDGGVARVAGYDVLTERQQVRHRISLTGQYAAVDELQTGAENLRMMGRLSRLSRSQSRRRAAELLERFDLTAAAGRRVTTYSGGMRRRLDLAASLVAAPPVIFLDEPTTGLDPRSRQAMRGMITELADSGVTIFLTTQYLEEADQMADRIALLDGGRIVAEGTPAQLKEQVAEQRLELTATDVAAFRAIAASLGRRAIVADESRLTLDIATDGSAAHVRALLDDIDPRRDSVQKFTVHTATLDDVFLSLTGHATQDKETAGV